MENNHNSVSDLFKTPSHDERFDQLAVQIHAAESHKALVTLLRNQLLDTYRVEMASIFLVDSLKMQLVSWVVLPGESLRKIRIPIDKTSIAGYAAASRSPVLIQDPYDSEELQSIDPELKFDSSWDRQTGTRTWQVLATPIIIHNSLLGVIQMMNKRGELTFSEEDEHLVQKLANTLGNALLKLQSD